MAQYQLQLKQMDRLKTYRCLENGYKIVATAHKCRANEDLVKKCYNSLNPGGKIVFQGWIMNDEKTEPFQGAIYAINMLLVVEGGDGYSENEVSSRMKNTGFTDISKVILDQGLGQMTGVKFAR